MRRRVGALALFAERVPAATREAILELGEGKGDTDLAHEIVGGAEVVVLAYNFERWTAWCSASGLAILSQAECEGLTPDRF